MSNIELSNFIDLHCTHCDNKATVKVGGKPIYICSAGKAEEYYSNRSCSSAIVFGKEGVMSSGGFTRNEGEHWVDLK